jgi:hypothetical protein
MENPQQNQISQKLKKPSDAEFAMAMSQAGVLTQAPTNPMVQVPTTQFSEVGKESATSLVQPNQKSESDSQINQWVKEGLQLPQEMQPQSNEKGSAHQITDTTVAGLKSMESGSKNFGTQSLQEQTLSLNSMNFQNPQMNALQSPPKGDSQNVQVETQKAKRGGVVQEGVLGQNQQPQDLMKDNPIFQSEVISEGTQMGVAGHFSQAQLQGQSGTRKPNRTDFSSGGEFLNTLNSVKGGVEVPGLNSSSTSNLKTMGNSDLISQSKLEQLKGEKKGKGPISDEKDSTLLSSKKEYSTDTPFMQMVTPHGVNSLNVSHLGNGNGKPTIEMSAQVVPGANAQDRLSTDAMIGVSGGIRNLSSQNGGEMRIRLRPDHLGELNVRVTTKGGEVGLQIQASDEKAKKIIEDSLHYLKENLSAHQLSLGQVDLTVGTSQLSSNLSNNQDSNSDSRHSQSHLNYQGDFNQDRNQSGHQRQSDSWLGSDSLVNSRNLSGRPAAGLAARNWDSRSGNINQVANGRLDVKA